ncbi:MAG: hypothetical protein HON90_05935, partial [Halobacteriovoraceae bacterium]|nr:hypothetical protein [Halobacteriovoraceae bacterium]
IKIPSLELSMMHSDQKNKQSLEIKYKNWTEVHFRAYRFSPIDFLLKQQDRNTQPVRKDVEAWITNKKVSFEWSEKLPLTKDYKTHKTYFTPKISQSGSYIVVASANKNFSMKENRLLFGYYQQTNLFLLRKDESDTLDFKVVKSSSGMGVANAEIKIFKLDWKKGHSLYKTLITDKFGSTSFKKDKKRTYGVVYFVKSKGQELYDYNSDSINSKRNPTVSTTNKSLIFTDRSIYRPNQKINFKVISYQNNNQRLKLPKGLPGVALSVSLHDSNGKKVTSINLKTNKFASASGVFEIPNGHALGRWSLRVNNSRSRVNLRVEEYKRPTFTTTLGDAKGQIRLNTKATFSANAKYYFGLPVTAAKISYIIKRKTNYPYWYSWWYANYSVNEQIIKTGEIKTDKNGDYEISFTPKASKLELEQGLSFNYNIEVVVLNNGGESAKASKSFIIGPVAVKSYLYLESEFNQKNIKITASRKDLNGKSLPGKAQYKLYKLSEPKKTLAPVNQALYYGERSPLKNIYQTLGDFQRARWNGSIDEKHILKTWPVGKLVEFGDVLHDKHGAAKIVINKLSPGAYRIKYTTKDVFGSLFKTNKDFIILNKKSKLSLPLILRVNKQRAYVGEKLKFFVHSGYKDQLLIFDIYHFDKKIYSKKINSSHNNKFITFWVKNKHLGGLTVQLHSVHDNTFMQKKISINIPYVKEKLAVEFERIREKIVPGTQEKWTVKVSAQNSKGKKIQLKKQAEIVAYMYDKSLDVFTSHLIPYLSYPANYFYPRIKFPYQRNYARSLSHHWRSHAPFQTLNMDMIQTIGSYGIGGMGRRGRGRLHMSGAKFLGQMESEADGVSSQKSRPRKKMSTLLKEDIKKQNQSDKSNSVSSNEQVRSNFSETAFWLPHLKTNKNGSLEFSFTVPDSLTSWNVWAHAITKDLKFGSTSKVVESAKDLMLQTYFPRFLRQSDKIDLKLVLNNGSKKIFKGKIFLEITDDDKNDISDKFLLAKKYKDGVAFNLKGQGSIAESVSISVPNNRLGQVHFKAYAKTKSFSDGEAKVLNILPSRMHLSQSKFVSLTNIETREINFKEMLKKDSSRINDSLVIKLDGQLFYSLVSALPYLKNSPYNNIDKYINTYVSTSILDETFKHNPKLAKMAKNLSKRKTQFEKWNENDPNRKVSLEETPWLRDAEGGSSENLQNTLDPKNITRVKSKNLKDLLSSQTSIGAFPWFKGGPPSQFMTIYVLNGFSRAAEFGAKLPTAQIKKAWSYIGRETNSMIKNCMANSSCVELITFINFTLSNYKDTSLYSEYISAELRSTMLDYSFKLWKHHSPQTKGMLALLLKRSNRPTDANLVFDSVLDSVKKDKDLGAFWSPEDRSWLWYNDTIQSHAYALRALTELKPKDSLRHDLVKWLFLNKKLGQWKSTRATAEVIYSVLHYLKAENLFGKKELIDLEVGDFKKSFEFQPDKYTGKDNFVVFKDNKLKPEKMHKIKISQKTKGISFASATWHYSTEKIPLKALGDLFSVKRTYFKRATINNQIQLSPIAEGTKIKVGDQVEVHLSIRSKHAAEYIHLRDPRPSGFEPERQISGYKWDLGLVRFEEVRDSGMNFFFEKLPVGEYTLKFRIRANLAGTFKTHPAILQSLYAPEFNAFSSGKIINVEQ